MKNSDYLKELHVNGGNYSYYAISLLQENNIADIDRLPYSIRILVENLLRKLDGKVVKENDLKNIACWQKSYNSPVEIPHHPARVLMQDFTGVPAVVDLASMRDAVKKLGGDPEKVNPLVPVELVIDHSVQVDHFGTTESLTRNVELEYERNFERYKLLKWAQKSFSNFNVVPPNSGICHQVNLEYLGRVVIADKETGILFPDTLVGLDSHTPMVNGIGVMGWGVGGIEAEAVMLGQPYAMAIPEVIGVRLCGRLRPGITATDLVLTLTELLRSNNVVEKFVEYFGEGVTNLSIPDRATIANMTPEYGATLGFFPIDDKTIDYLKLTGRRERAERTEAYARANRLFMEENSHQEYSKILELDLGDVVPSLAGPARPQDRIPLTQIKARFQEMKASDKTVADESQISLDGQNFAIRDGSIVIAAITSCTNTSNPNVLLGAGLMAQKAVQLGLKVAPYVKTSFAPGSRVVPRYLEEAGLTPYLEALGFHLTAFGCTTCIGNSGPLRQEIEQAIEDNNLNVAAVLSGNRNFEARIHQRIQSNFLASPMLVIAFALAGKIDIDMGTQPLGHTPNGEPVYLKDIWPDEKEIEALVGKHVKREGYEQVYKTIYDGDHFWQGIDIEKSLTFPWQEQSTYIKNPPYFEGVTRDVSPREDIMNARVFLLLGDTVTTDHISPAGSIPADYPAGRYLQDHGVSPADFNSYGSRRGNHEVMMRGTFGNIRIKNTMVGAKEGSYTLKQPEGKEMYNFDAAIQYMDEHTPLIILAGREYGTGSSRDWAAKGTNLLGIKAVIARSYERIHRNNLVGMGVLPLMFQENENAEDLGIKGDETFVIKGLGELSPRQQFSVTATKADGTSFNFNVVSRLDTDREILYFRHGGILPYVLRQMITKE